VPCTHNANGGSAAEQITKSRSGGGIFASTTAPWTSMQQVIDREVRTVLPQEMAPRTDASAFAHPQDSPPRSKQAPDLQEYISHLSIDKSFVRGLCTNAGDANIVGAVINMGKSFGLRVVAEGVETREQFLRLQAQQCAEGQGYYFQRPVAANEFAQLLGSDLSSAHSGQGGQLIR
jgi:EAL domain